MKLSLSALAVAGALGVSISTAAQAQTGYRNHAPVQRYVPLPFQPFQPIRRYVPLPFRPNGPSVQPIQPIPHYGPVPNWPGRLVPHYAPLPNPSGQPVRRLFSR